MGKAQHYGALNAFGRPTLEYADVKTPLKVMSGTWSGFLIRRSRKMGKCADCDFHLPSGVLYLEGEIQPDVAGGFGRNRICLKCAGPMPLIAVQQEALATPEALAPHPVCRGSE